ncbi:flagellar basal body-associated protein FliL [Photobacterium jeanii]|uniref:Flagellar protein FliL n=1 Tax=Photobacterium jeanii TaxID=858640 RepID=A0A178KMJ5_9GAMM|nr:flagellar basal body-associated protein FliL [Photobacterium jeanii]OAN18608.1 flagellar basal body-associated protein FliL [Photobacterium jeanii]PST91712.1 flagellar basal body-associated protein FliL [Photobacterium jeanii]
MADELQETSGSKKKLIIIIAAVVILLAGGGAAAWFMLGDDVPEPEVASEQTQATAAQNEPAYYVTLPQPFIFNVTGDKRDRLVQVKVQLMVRGDDNEETAKQHIPLLESTLLQTFGAATVEELRTPNGRVELREKALQSVQNALQKVSGQQVVERVLFTGFVMQ